MMKSLLGEILNVPMVGFDTYGRREWPELGVKEDAMYFTKKYIQEREKLMARKVGKGEMK